VVQASRNDPDGPFGDFYVWSDTDELYQDARIIFVDTETSNWTWDPVRGQYFWHRFYGHQPDLNFDNPAVHDAMFEASASGWTWASTASASTPSLTCTSARGPTARTCPRPRVPAQGARLGRYQLPGRVLLAEANQWPADVVDYFGDFAAGGDECHMCFHFPVMPRIFMSVRRESRYPISEILAQTPAIPSTPSGASSCATTTSSRWRW
jgi:maltose alpha-D-glucosyltransferase/alpha-amylase